jgi:type I restriction enzyme S subunit
VNWPSVTLDDVCEFVYGKALKADARRPGTVKVMGSNGVVGTHDASLTSGPTVVIGRKGSIGAVSFTDESCWPIDTAYYVDSTRTSADVRWLYWALQSLGLPLMNKSAAVPGLNREDAYRLSLPLPPLPEQRRIAAILDQADQLRVMQKRALAQVELVPDALFERVFGEEAHQVQLRPLGVLVAAGTSVTYGIVQAGPETPGGVPYIRTGDLVDGHIRAEGLRHTTREIAQRFPRSTVNAGEIVMSIRATVGTTALVPIELHGANLTQGTARIAPGPDLDAIYLLGYLRTLQAQSWIAAQVKGATFREITLGRLREMPVPVPPLDLQRRFVAAFESTEIARSLQARHLAKLDELFASLQYRAFRGVL